MSFARPPSKWNMQLYAPRPGDADDDGDGDEDVDSTRRPSVSLVAVQAVRLHRSAFMV